jgi:hypothetical protein
LAQIVKFDLLKSKATRVDSSWKSWISRHAKRSLLPSYGFQRRNLDACLATRKSGGIRSATGSCLANSIALMNISREWNFGHAEQAVTGAFDPLRIAIQVIEAQALTRIRRANWRSERCAGRRRRYRGSNE